MKIPTIVRLVSEIPRNAMGKVNKKQVLKELFLSKPSAAPRDS